MAPLRISYQNYYSIKNLDPAKISTLEEANLIENIYSRILEYDNAGMLVCVLCESFTIENNTISMPFKAKLKTNSGDPITAKDAELSLKRLYRMNTNTHGNLDLFISSENNITSDNNILKIEMKNSNYSHFLLPLLASMDFSIIPISAFDNNLIKTHEITSGPYYVSKDDELGYITLTANKNHSEYSEEMYQEIKIIPSEKGDVIEDYNEKKVDVVDITNTPTIKTYTSFFQKNKKHTATKTQSLNLFLLNSSAKAQKDFSSEQLFYAFNIIKNILLKLETHGYDLKQSNEFIPANGNGHLSKDQSEIIESNRAKNTIPVFNQQISFGVRKSIYEAIKEQLKDYKEIKVLSLDKNPANLTPNERPDIFIRTTDASFNEDISLLSYNFSMEYFGKTKSEGEKWLKEYIDIEDKSERIKKLQDLHFEILKRGVIYPIGISPYWAIANEDIELNFPTLFPGSHWWKIRKK